MRGNAWRRWLDRVIGIPLCFLLGTWARLRGNLPAAAPPERILILKLAAMGDTVLLIPALRAIRRAYPGARIAMAVTGINADVLRHCPYVDRLFQLDLQGAPLKPGRLWVYIQELRHFAPDLALDCEQWSRLTPLLAYFSGAGRRMGFRTSRQARHYLFTDVVPHVRGRHEVQCFLDLTRALGIEPADDHLELFLDETSRSAAQELLRRHDLNHHKPLVLFHPGCGKDGQRREWSPERYAQLGDMLVERYGARILITGDLAERPLARAIANRMKVPAVEAAGETSLLGLAALVARSDLVVCGNTGTLHLASAAGVPTVALHGPTDPQKWGPWKNRAQVVRLGLPCSPCLYLGHEYGCRPAPCMGKMTVEAVWMAVQALMGAQSQDMVAVGGKEAPP